jgi:DNA polymerase III delta prime subunit
LSFLSPTDTLRGGNHLAAPRAPGMVDVMSTPSEPPPAYEDLRGLARSLRLLFDIGVQALTEDAGPSELAHRVTEHLGCQLLAIVQVTERFPSWENVNVQRGVDAYLAARGSAPDWFGSAGLGHRPHEDLLSLINMRGHANPIRVRPGVVRFTPSSDMQVGPASYGTAPVGPQENTEVVTFGLVATTAPDGSAVVIGIRDESRFGPPFYNLEILAADQAAASATRDEIDRLKRVHDVFRGQVLSFTSSEHHGNELVTFLPRPAIAAQDVVLPEGMLDNIERHIIGIAEWSRDLLEAGQHLKRGLLLHGPPGTGKTHTIRYLTGRLTSSTIILLTGRSIRFIDQAAALARRLQPSMVVLEDVDLVAADRDFAQDGNPLLFSLLDAMDGVGADADVTFALTTNRANILETALADRPGRVDLAIEIPRPDAQSRRRLLQVYARDVAVDADLDEVVAGSEGVTASFIKELIRRTVLVSLRAGERPPVLRDAHFAEVLAEMNGEHHALTRALLGAGEPIVRSDRKAGHDRTGGSGDAAPRQPAIFGPTTSAACSGRPGCSRRGTAMPQAQGLEPQPSGFAAGEQAEHDQADRDQDQQPRAERRAGQRAQRGVHALGLLRLRVDRRDDQEDTGGHEHDAAGDAAVPAEPLHHAAGRRTHLPEFQITTELFMPGLVAQVQPAADEGESDHHHQDLAAGMLQQRRGEVHRLLVAGLRAALAERVLQHAVGDDAVHDRPGERAQPLTGLAAARARRSVQRFG